MSSRIRKSAPLGLSAVNGSRDDDSEDDRHVMMAATKCFHKVKCLLLLLLLVVLGAVALNCARGLRSDPTPSPITNNSGALPDPPASGHGGSGGSSASISVPSRATSLSAALQRQYQVNFRAPTFNASKVGGHSPSQNLIARTAWTY
jgi:hypothetical protein